MFSGAAAPEAGNVSPSSAAPGVVDSMASVVPPHDRRLRESRQFREAYRSGRSFHGTLMTLVSLVRTDDHARVAFVASRRVGSAVRRNRAKRLLREAWRATPSAVRDEACWRIWIARAPCSRATLGAVKSEMDRLLARRRTR